MDFELKLLDQEMEFRKVPNLQFCKQVMAFIFHLSPGNFYTESAIFTTFPVHLFPIKAIAPAFRLFQDEGQVKIYKRQRIT